MNEINKLIWPAPQGVGVMNPVAFVRTAAIAKQFKVISKPATKAAYRTDLARAANTMLKKQGVNTTGASWKAVKITVTAGGK
jgi:NitT/TauT family transport system substrate-binding protein